jgi:23S rRNA (adenine2503-C2)-methyltransferase
MKELRSRHFTNGSVYCLELEDGRLIETTDTFLPYYTKECVNGTNALRDGNIGSRAERWMIGVSTMSGCPVGCKFCATGQMKGWRNLTAKEITDQVKFVMLEKNEEFLDSLGFEHPKELKINYTRMGEPFLNIDEVRKAIDMFQQHRNDILFHHYISTIGVRGSDFSWIKDNITLQISLHSLDEDRRRELIPVNNLMTIEELGQIRTKSKLKTTVNLTLVDEADFDIDKLKRYFDPKYFFIKLSPINRNEISDQNGLGAGIITTTNII